VRNPRVQLYAIELRSTQWGEVLQWYREVLGLWVAIRVPEDEYALLIAGEGRLALMGRGTATRNDRVSLAFEVADLEEVEARLLASGTDVERVADHAEGLTLLRTADPDGNRITLFRWPASAGARR
jgi:predicted enzyme related to lactoylglutathione lyase